MQVLLRTAVSSLDLRNGAVANSLEMIGDPKLHVEFSQYTQPNGNAILWQVATTGGHMSCKQVITTDGTSHSCQRMVVDKVRINQ